MNEPVELAYEKCRELISGCVVGRVAVSTPTGPRIVPVNYAVVDDAVVFRTTPYSLLGTYAWNTILAFEIDNIDYENERGWSVVAVGRGTMVEDRDELARIRSFWDPQPWVGGPRLLYVMLRWDELTGRRIGASWNYTNEPSVQRAVV